MRAETLLADLRTRGVELQVAGDRLRFHPVDAVSPDLLVEMREHKSELLGLLGDRVGDAVGGADAVSVTTSEVCEMPLSEFADARLVVEVSSRVLGETVLFASDNAVVDPGEQRPVYRAAELKALVGLSAGDLEQVHRVKKTFKGTVLG